MIVEYNVMDAIPQVHLIVFYATIQIIEGQDLSMFVSIILIKRV